MNNSPLNNSPERLNFLKSVLQQLSAQSINYCILRNYEFLLGSSDPIESLDVAVSKDSWPKLDSLLCNLGFTRRKQQFSLRHKAYFRFIGKQHVSFDVQVGGVYWNDLLYLDEKIIRHRVKKDYFYVPSENDTFVLLLTHSILGKRRFKPKYQQILRLSKVDKGYVITNLSKIFNPKIAEQLFEKVQQNKFEEIPIRKLVAYFILKKPQNSFILSALFCRWVWQRKNPFRLSPLISVLGPDGAGKSTLVDTLTTYLQQTGRKTAVVYMGRGRGHVLPITKLGQKYKRKEKQDNPTPTLEKISLKKRLTYTLYSPVFTLDLLLRYYLKILPSRFQKKIVLTDRYCSDIILMKNVPLWLKKLLLSLFPRPTLTLFLYNTPEILHQRRPEETLFELQRQLDIFPILTKRLNSVNIKTQDQDSDSTRAVQEVAAQLLVNWW
ncbi:MAG TPA: hypothetical protein VJC39_03930 [Candidatus Nanoarchaeia archaeon]|nr:hypothetical protein [Candidatus Nanoarchaeia archaeon]